MSFERRRYQRLVRPFEATWQGASGKSPCRMADISWGGCFLQTITTPGIQERTSVTFSFEAREMMLEGVVVYIEPAMGFAVQFDPFTPDQVDLIKDLLGDQELWRVGQAAAT